MPPTGSGNERGTLLYELQRLILGDPFSHQRQTTTRRR